MMNHIISYKGLNIIVWSFFLLAGVCFAQDPEDAIGPDSYEVQLIPASPEVASLGKYGNQPLNKYNGTANINIPIHQISFEGMTIPLNLSYNTGGVMANQDATWVGLGWNVSDGITITRQVNGFDDLRNVGYSASIQPTTPGKDNVGWIYSSNSYINNQDRISGNNLFSIDTQFQNNSPIDLEPDLFTLNTPNGSCKFYLPKKGTSTELIGQVVNNVNFKIFYYPDSYTFKVIDPRGYTYHFNNYELSTGFSSWDAQNAQSNGDALSGMTPYSTNQTKYTITAWRPETIVSPLNRVLSFEFENGHHFSFPSFSETFSQQIYNSNNQVSGWYDPIEIDVNSPTSVSASMNAFHNLYLKRISGDFGTVDFVLGNERLDLFSVNAFKVYADKPNWTPQITPTTFAAKRLNSIEVFNKQDTFNPIKKAEFEYSYFNEDEISNLIPERFLRLKLDMLTLEGKDYEFSYIECNSLPTKDTKAIDFWGYYNGVDTNAHSIPSFNRFYLNYPSPTNGNQAHEQFFKFKGANRAVDGNKASHGLLNIVRYPTKGYTEYKFEANRATVKKAFFQQQPITNLYLDSRFSSGKVSSLSSSASYSFNFQYLKLQDDPTYSLYNQQHQGYSPSVYEDFEVGGLRVAEIIDKDMGGEPLAHRKFEYSNGVLMNELIFHSKGLASKWEYTPENYSDDGTVNSASVHSDNMLRSNNSASGSHIGYTEVVERRFDKQGADNGFIKTRYNNDSNQPITRDLSCTPQFTSFTTNCQSTYACWDNIYVCSDYDAYNPSMKLSYGDVYILGVSPRTYEHSNGKVKFEWVYDASGTELTKTESIYEEVTRQGSTASKYPIMNWQQNAQSLPIGHPYQIVDGNSFNINKEYRIVESIRTQSFESGDLVNTINYSYGSHNQLVQVQSKNSKGELYTTKAYYPKDVESEPFMSDLLSSNQTVTKIKSEIYKGTDADPENQLILSQRTTFSDEHNTPQAVLPSEVITLKDSPSGSNAEEETRQVYDRYDDYGNLRQYHIEKGPFTTYVWGSKGQYLMAKVENATFANVQSTGADLAIIDEPTSSLSEIANELQKIRDGLSDAMVTSFTYQPMVGIKSVTDPRGYTTHYNYDNSNRLKQITDNRLNLIEDYEYRYVENNSAIPCTYLPENTGPRLVLNEGTTDRGATFSILRIVASGGNGTYTYKWFEGVGPSRSEFHPEVKSTLSEYSIDIGCDEKRYFKVEVSSGNQKGELILDNSNFPCLDGEDPANNN